MSYTNKGIGVHLILLSPSSQVVNFMGLPIMSGFLGSSPKP